MTWNTEIQGGNVTLLTIVLPPSRGWDWYNAAKVGWGIGELVLLPSDEWERRYYYIPCSPHTFGNHPLKDYFSQDVASRLVRYGLYKKPEIVVSDEIIIGELRAEERDDEYGDDEWLENSEEGYEIRMPVLYDDDVWSAISAVPPAMQDGVSYRFVEDEFCYEGLSFCQMAGWMAWGVEFDMFASNTNTVTGKIHRLFGISLPMVVTEGMRIHKKKICGRDAIVAIKEGEGPDDGVCGVLEYIVRLAQTEAGRGLLEGRREVICVGGSLAK